MDVAYDYVNFTINFEFIFEANVVEQFTNFELHLDLVLIYYRKTL